MNTINLYGRVSLPLTVLFINMKKFDENRTYAILGDCKRGAISIELGVFNIKDMFNKQILSLIEELEDTKQELKNVRDSEY